MFTAEKLEEKEEQKTQVQETEKETVPGTESRAETGKAQEDNEDREKRKPFILRHKQLTALVIVMLGVVLLNFISWRSQGFSDLYRAHIFPIWMNTYGRFSSVFPFSLGEVMICIAVFGIPVSLIAMIVLLIVMKGRRKKVGRIFGFVYAWIFAFICVTETNNCFLLYHCASFAEQNGIKVREHSREELEALGDRLVGEINILAQQVQRDENDRFILTADLDRTARESMAKLGDEFDFMGGYYVRPKPIHFSFFMSQMDLMGIYFPFSMEANYNNDMTKCRTPATVCHELAHTKGFIREDEANFIAFMACERSDNVEYRYSGYLLALIQVRNRIFDYADEEQMIAFDSSISDLVWTDLEANSEYWEAVEEADDTVFDTQTVSEISEKALETNLQLNGVEDGLESYGRMVDLLLDYYMVQDMR